MTKKCENKIETILLYKFKWLYVTLKVIKPKIDHSPGNLKSYAELYFSCCKTAAKALIVIFTLKIKE